MLNQDNHLLQACKLTASEYFNQTVGEEEKIHNLSFQDTGIINQDI